MTSKIISISPKRQITIPLSFFKRLNFSDHAECTIENNAIVIRPAETGIFDEEILEDLIKEGLSGEQLLNEFKTRKKKIRPAVEKMIKKADDVANGNGDFATYNNVFGSDDEI